MKTLIINRHTGIGFDKISFEEPISNSTDVLKASCVATFYDYINNRIEHTLKLDIYDSNDVFKSTSYDTYMTYNEPAVVETEVDEQGDYVKDVEILEEAYNRVDELNVLFSPSIKPLIIQGMRKHLGY